LFKVVAGHTAKNIELLVLLKKRLS